MPGPYKKIRVERSGNLYNLIADGIARGVTDDEGVARLLGDPLERQPHVEKLAAAFTDENPYARSAESALASLGGLSPQDEARAEIIGEAQALATLALAFEQRQTRFDLDGTLRDYLPGRVV